MVLRHNQYIKSTGDLLEYKKYHYFYKITNQVNGKYYYGIHSTDDLDDGYKGSGLRLSLAYKKYGEGNFKKEIIKFFETRKEASEYEESVVTEDEVNSEDCYNLTIGGDRGICNAFKGRHHSDKTKLLIREKMSKPIEELKQKRKTISKDGIKKSVSIKNLQPYLNDGWKIGARGCSYVHTMNEYRELLRKKKETKEETKEIVKQKKNEENKKIYEILLNIANDKTILLNEFGWNKIIIKMLKDNEIDVKSNVRRYIKRHCPEFFELKEVYNKKL